MAIYIVDSNFFIQAHRERYPLTIAVGFWQKVKQLAEEGKIISIDKVKDEVYGNEDELKAWCIDNLPSDFFHDTSTVLAEYSIVTGWANSRNSQYTPSAITEFLDAKEADAWLVAFALHDTTNRILVTYEISAPLIKHKVKIPEACNATGAIFIKPIEMFRQLGESF